MEYIGTGLNVIDSWVPAPLQVDQLKRPLCPKARLTMEQTCTEETVTFHMGIRQTEKNNYDIPQLDYNFNGLMKTFEAFKFNDFEAFEEGMTDFWQEPLLMPIIETADPVEDQLVTLKKEEGALFQSRKVPDYYKVLNPAKGTCVRLLKASHSGVAVVCMQRETEEAIREWEEIVRIARDAGFRGRMHFDTKYTPEVGVHYYIGYGAIVDGFSLFGFEFNPYGDVMRSCRTMSIVDSEESSITIMYTQKDYIRVHKWSRDAGYRRVSMDNYYQALRGDRLNQSVGDTVRERNFIYSPDIKLYDNVFFNTNVGEIKSQDTVEMAAEMYFYDIHTTKWKEISINGEMRKLELVYSKEGLVDVMGTPWVFSTRRSFLQRQGYKLAKMYETSIHMKNPVVVSEISHNAYRVTENRQRYSRYTYSKVSGIAGGLQKNGKDITPIDIMGIVFISVEEVRVRRGKRRKWVTQKQYKVDESQNSKYYVSYGQGQTNVWIEDDLGPYYLSRHVLEYSEWLCPKCDKYNTGQDVQCEECRSYRYVRHHYSKYPMKYVKGLGLCILTSALVYQKGVVQHVKLKNLLNVDVARKESDRYIYQDVYNEAYYKRIDRRIASVHYDEHSMKLLAMRLADEEDDYD